MDRGRFRPPLTLASQDGGGKGQPTRRTTCMNQSTLDQMRRTNADTDDSRDLLEAAWAASDTQRTQATDRLRLIVADPDPLARRVIRDSLRASGQFVVAAEAKDGTEAVELATHYKPELVLMEIRLPCIDGI